jgi:hypothetical protein
MAGSYPTAFRVIAMPYEVGRLREGVGRGPEHLLEQGAEAALASGGATVTTELVELDAPADNEVDTVMRSSSGSRSKPCRSRRLTPRAIRTTASHP